MQEKEQDETQNGIAGADVLSRIPQSPKYDVSYKKKEKKKKNKSKLKRIFMCGT